MYLVAMTMYTIDLPVSSSLEKRLHTVLHTNDYWFSICKHAVVLFCDFWGVLRDNELVERTRVRDSRFQFQAIQAREPHFACRTTSVTRSYLRLVTCNVVEGNEGNGGKVEDDLRRWKIDAVSAKVCAARSVRMR